MVLTILLVGLHLTMVTFEEGARTITGALRALHCRQCKPFRRILEVPA